MEETQQATQSTQSSSQQNSSLADANSHLWGFLQPCGTQLRRIDFFKIVPTVGIGRNPEGNEVVLPGVRVSNKHCRIIWDGKEDEKSAVIVADYSSNGTWINGVRIGKDKTAILKEGNEIAFGTPQPQPGSLEDYRFIYRHTAAGPPKKGIHAFYDISHELGKGSFATVMKAISRATGQWYAIKMIQESRIRRVAAQEHSRNIDKEQKDSVFIREISILETLDHVNICQLKEVFREGDNIDLVLEYVDGGDLLEFILKNNGLDEPMATHITRQICEALAYIHGKGIAHRDLKPENVLLTSDNPPIVKVADFGLAKVVDSLTFLKTMCGTPSYLAPEVVTQNNEEGYSHLVDSWSVGVIVFCMLTSSTPFIEGEAHRDMKVRVAERVIDWGALDSAGVSDLAKDFVRQLLEYDPLKRLSLTAARGHPWLNQNYGSHYAPREIQVDSSVASFGPVGSSLTSLPDEDMALMDDVIHDDDIDGDGDGPGGMQTKLEKLQLNQQQRNGQHALQRRSQVLAAAAEKEQELPEPSWQMLNAVGALPPLRAAKRKLGEGSPSGDGGPDSSGVSMTPGRGGRGTRATRGKARPVVGRSRLHDAAAGMVVEEEHGNEGEVAPPKPRRSSRHSPAKMPRRI